MSQYLRTFLLIWCQFLYKDVFVSIVTFLSLCFTFSPRASCRIDDVFEYMDGDVALLNQRTCVNNAKNYAWTTVVCKTLVRTGVARIDFLVVADNPLDNHNAWR